MTKNYSRDDFYVAHLDEPRRPTVHESYTQGSVKKARWFAALTTAAGGAAIGLITGFGAITLWILGGIAVALLVLGITAIVILQNNGALL